MAELELSPGHHRLHIHIHSDEPEDTKVDQPPTTTPEKHPFAPTATKFGIIQREIERVGLPSHSQNKEFKHVLKPDAIDIAKTDAFVAKLNISATESIFGVDAKVDANLAVLHVKDDKREHLPFETMIGNINANARAGFGLTGVGATAAVTGNALTASLGPVSGNLGIGITTGAFVSPTQVTVLALGTGVSLGERTGISVLGSGVSIDLGKTFEEVANHFVHHDPHAHIHQKLEKASQTTKEVLGIDIATGAVDKHVVQPTKTVVKKGLHEVEEEIKKGAVSIKVGVRTIEELVLHDKNKKEDQ